MYFKKYLLLVGAVFFCACLHDYKNPLDPQNQVNDRPPVADFTVSSFTAPINATVTFDASPSGDPDNTTDNLEIRWDFNADGIWEIPWFPFLDRKIVSTKFPAADSYKVIMEVKDPGNKIGRREKRVFIIDTTAIVLSPFAFFMANPRLPNPGDTIIFDATASRNSQGNTGNLEYRWQWDALETWEGPVTNAIIRHVYAVAAAKKTITLQVRDVTTNQTAQSSVGLSVKRALPVENAPYAAFSVMPASGRVQISVSNSVTVDANPCQDREDTPQTLLKLCWDWGDGIYQTDFQPFDQRKILSHPYANQGKHTITLKVQDSNNNVSLAKVQILVGP